MNATVLVWTTFAPDPLSKALIDAGFRVVEAMALFEVKGACEATNIDVVVIRAKVDESCYPELKQHHITMKLKGRTKPADVVNELWRMFPDKGTSVQ
jgi:hypothetical protein